MSHLCPLSLECRICVLLEFRATQMCPYASMQTWHVRKNIGTGRVVRL